MTYEIMLLRLRPGLTLLGTLDARNAELGPDAELPELHPTPAQWAEWERIVTRVSREISPVGTAQYPRCLTLDTIGLPWRVQLDYYGDSADVEVAYTHTGIAARAVAEAAYLVARVVEEETGMVGHDFEVDQPTMTGDPAVAATRLGAVNAWIRGRCG
ncbi:hypothetical protein ABT026_17140 [Streptomyces sp. NPDC002734]|uniref:hypothetical protein n=1 Tax=Streptomyces sp. NPDC002734 TaxID=3154426 RepID=UPI0033275718